jgi:homoserine kinase
MTAGGVGKAHSQEVRGVSWSERPARVRAPATSANLGPGFDALGLALALHDEVEARVTDGGLVIEVAGEGGGTAAAGERHLVVRAMRAAFGAIGGQPPGIALRCANAIPHGRGLGSSAAAICSGVLAARALAGADGTRLSDEAVFQLAVKLEGHPDNVAACLAGGLTIAWAPRPAPAAPAGAGELGAGELGVGESGVGEPGAGEPGAGEPGGARLLRIGVPAALRAVACVPAVPLATEAARQALPQTVPHADAAANAARSALLIAALTGAPHLLLDATEDFLHQPYRAAIMPETASLLGALRRARAAAVVSGAGPTVLVLSFDRQWPSAEAVDSIARETGIAWHVIPLHIDQQGAHVQQGGLDVHPPVSAQHAATRDQGPSWNQSRDRAEAAREGPGVTGPVSGVRDRQQPKECRGLRWC